MSSTNAVNINAPSSSSSSLSSSSSPQLENHKKQHGSTTPAVVPKGGNWNGFIAGIFSGITKQAVGHPFDTIKVRLQTSKPDMFRGPIDCLTQTLRKEGINGLYKGATPPLIGWIFMDSLMLGSLTLYRGLLNEHIFLPSRTHPTHPASTLPPAERARMPALGHALAGMAAGWTVSLAATPVEHIKARLQVQYQADRTRRTYRGPVDAFRRIYAGHGLRGLWHGLFATTLFRSFFFTMWGAYDLCTRQLERNFPAMSTPAVNFWAGGLAAQAFWLTSYPADVVKQRIMTDSLEPATRRFPRWRDAVVAVYRESGWRGYWRGFAPCFLRAFPANAMAVAAFEGVLRALNRRDAGL